MIISIKYAEHDDESGRSAVIERNPGQVADWEVLFTNKDTRRIIHYTRLTRAQAAARAWIETGKALPRR